MCTQTHDSSLAMSMLLHSSNSENCEEQLDVWDDDGDGNLMALFVLDEIPVAVSPMSTLNSAHC
jgi:hypothetical protein